MSSISSTNSTGSTSITLQFDLDRDIDAAAQDVQVAISRTTRQLPPDMPTPPSFQKVNPAEQPILYMAVKSDRMTLSKLDEYAEQIIARRISMVSGIASVNVYGSKKYAVRIQIDPDKIASRKMGLEEVRNAVTQSNLNIPTGIPLVYELGDDMKPLKSYYLGDEEAVKAAQQAVANQGKAK